jgi:hypothetical protein
LPFEAYEAMEGFFHVAEATSSPARELALTSHILTTIRKPLRLDFGTIVG